MRILLATVLTGCSAVSAVGSFIKPAPPQVTVNTHVEVAAVKPEKSSAATPMVAGAVAGGVAAALVRTTPESIAAGALVGTALGYVVHTALD